MRRVIIFLCSSSEILGQCLKTGHDASRLTLIVMQLFDDRQTMQLRKRRQKTQQTIRADYYLGPDTNSL